MPNRTLIPTNVAQILITQSPKQQDKNIEKTEIRTTQKCRNCKEEKEKKEYQRERERVVNFVGIP